MHTALADQLYYYPEKGYTMDDNQVKFIIKKDAIHAATYSRQVWYCIG